MFKLNWYGNRYSVKMLPKNDSINWHNVLAEYKKRNNRYHVVLKKEPIELTEAYHDAVKIENPIQKHFTSEVEAKQFIESYYKSFNLGALRCQ